MTPLLKVLPRPSISSWRGWDGFSSMVLIWTSSSQPPPPGCQENSYNRDAFQTSLFQFASPSIMPPPQQKSFTLFLMTVITLHLFFHSTNVFTVIFFSFFHCISLLYVCTVMFSFTEADKILRWPQSWHCTKLPLLLLLLVHRICFYPISSSSLTCAVRANCLQGGKPLIPATCCMHTRTHIFFSRVSGNVSCLRHAHTHAQIHTHLY